MKGLLAILTAGSLVTVQDLGRKNASQYGVTQSGAADPLSFKLANLLCSNEEHSPALEITIAQFKAKILNPITIAVTGADATVLVNQKTMPLWQSIDLKAGDIIEIKSKGQQIRNYLAIHGSFMCPSLFNSSSTVLRERLGLRINKGDVLFGQNAVHSKPRRLKQPPMRTLTGPLRVLASYQAAEFSDKAKQRFFNTRFTISPYSDRMAYTLLGNTIESPQRARYSEGICLGAIQVPPNGQPLILLNDRQTIGGYPKIGTLISADCAILCQQPPRTEIQFKSISLSEAQSDARQQQIAFESLKQSVLT